MSAVVCESLLILRYHDNVKIILRGACHEVVSLSASHDGVVHSHSLPVDSPFDGYEKRVSRITFKRISGKLWRYSGYVNCDVLLAVLGVSKSPGGSSTT